MGLCSSVLVVCVACGGSDDPAGTNGSTSEASSSETSASTMPSAGSGADTTGSASSDGGSSTTSTTDVSTTDATGTTDGGTTEGPQTDGTTTGDSGDSGDSGSGTGNPGGMPNGSPCASPLDCVSNECFLVPVLGGVCSECTDESDCPMGGCSVPNPLANLPAVCNDGTLGGGCDTNAGCNAPLTCEVIITSPILTASTCSSCTTDADCGPDLCVPSYDVFAISGFKQCEPAGSVPNGEGCELGPTGDASCMSGHCVTASLAGLADLGVCSECAIDGHCALGQTCADAEIDLALGLVPAMCR
mgnify:CR=1 FL=1